MGCGLLDSIYDVIQLSSEINVSSSPLPNTTTEVMEIEPSSKENTSCINGAHNKSEDNGTGHSVYSLSLCVCVGNQFLLNHCYKQAALFHISICSCRCCY